MRPSIPWILVFVLVSQTALGETPDPKSTAVAAVSPAVAVKNPVVGSATIGAEAKTATMSFVYEREGKQLETTIPPKMRIVRITSSVPKLAVKLPTDIFAIKIGPDMQRIFDEPVLLDSDQAVVCSCRMRDDCGKGGVFRCGVEGELVD